MLDDDLKKSVVEEMISVIGRDRVFHEKTDLIPFAKDTFALRFSEQDKYLPDIVVIPNSTADVSSIVRIAARHHIPLIPKGGGTSRTGMLVPIHGGIVIDTIRMNRLLSLDRRDMLVTVQAGINLQELELLLSKQGFTIGHEQGSQKIATVGGAISTAAYSRKNQKYGNIWERISSLQVVLGDSTVLRTGPIVPYTSSTVGITAIFVGAEGTLGVITEVTLRVEVAPEVTSPVLAAFPDYESAEDAADQIVSRGVSFIGGGIWEDERGLPDLGDPDAKAGMLLAFEGTEPETKAAERISTEIIGGSGGKLADAKSAAEAWSAFLMHWCGMRAEIGHEDVIVAYVPRTREKEYFGKLLGDILPRHGLRTIPGANRSLDFGRHMIFGTRFSIPSTDEGWESYIAAVDEASSLISSLGGTVAACHGLGLLHRDHIASELGEEYIALYRRIKKVMDPKGIMNPGKKFPDGD
ncbi:MAG TPA: FAD-binding oxidoreductase [Euryarchaeota archaeon]|nr:FAD-binding oxidoreductase [Euryarchaeota archaeon]